MLKKAKLDRYRREVRVMREARAQHDVGFLLPAMVWVAELILLPVQVLIGPRQPVGADAATRETRLAYYRRRAKKVEVMVLAKLGLGGLFLFLAPIFHPSLVFKVLLATLGGYCVLNVLASVFHYAVTGGTTKSRESAAILSVPRSIVLSLFNYLELLTWFAAFYIAIPSFGDKHLEVGEAFYFSSVTALTIGYGDITPKGFARFLVIAEAFASISVISILVGRILGTAKPMDEYVNEESDERFPMP